MSTVKLRTDAWWLQPPVRTP